MRPRWVIAVVAAPALALVPVPSAAAPAPAPVTPEIETVPLSSARGLTRAADVRELRSENPFALAAARWSGAAPDVLDVRAQATDGTWGDWVTLEAVDGRGGVRASEPVWLGDSTALRVRAERGGAPVDAAELSIVLIDPGDGGTVATRAAAADVAQPPVINRAAWGADETIRTNCFAQQGIGVEYSPTVKAATIHHTAGTNDYTAADSARIVRGIYAYHAQDLGWCDIGYNVLVDKYGQIFEGRFGGLDKPVWGAHAGGFNKFTVGMSMLGTFTDVAPTPEQLESVSRFLAWKLARGYRDPNGTVTLVSGGGGTARYPEGTEVELPTIYGHRDVGYTECPGELGYQQLPAVRQRVTELMAGWDTSPVYQRWQAAGADAGALGGVYELERSAANGGLRTTFASGAGSVYWSEGTGARIIGGAIRDTWAAYGSEAGHLGYPRTDELATPDNVGRYNHFAGAGGSIYWTPSTGAHEIRGSIKTTWGQLGWERGPLKYPTTDERGTPDGRGRYNHFQNGSIYWTSSTGAQAIYGAIKSKWGQLGWERGPLGYPKTSEQQTPDGRGRYNHFEGGSIYWTSATGAHEIRGAIKTKWAQLGWERSFLGYPTSDEFAISGGRRSNFERGYITWNAATGVTTARSY
ncbi:N-acetylmuramoyl-L-alanine amidase [Prauserella flavalba]|uniref:N-acetylmuramoyl-L-alanine amidase n=1 Tax=Prauserella flavalba TaxID=1477506 RepID=UPI0036E838C7